ncbi:hypothetical protein F8514_04980 [Bacillus toyonensis]|nr:hypothetical protein F8514_04980 [Bacillus toyonensis]
MDTSTTYSFTLLHLFCIAVVASLSVEFPVTYRSPSTYYLLPTTYYLLPTTYYLLPAILLFIYFSTCLFIYWIICKF